MGKILEQAIHKRNMADQYMDYSSSLESNEIQLKGGTIFTYQTGTFVYLLFIPVIIG